MKYNPLFLWGGPGLGKTHLLQAIGHYVTENFPHKKVIFVTSEQFTDDFVNSLRAKRVDGFKQKYRSADVLLDRRYSVPGEQRGDPGAVLQHLQ